MPVPKTRSSRALVVATGGLALAVTLELASVHEAAARPGGGQSYSGSSHSSGSSSRSSGSSSRSSSRSSYGGSSSSSSRSTRSSGGSSYSTGTSGSRGPVNEAISLLFGLLGIGLLLAWMRWKMASEREDRYESTHVTWSPPRHTLAEIRARDPDFSAVLFEDFVYALYARVQAARGDPKAMAALAPYVAADTRTALLAREPSGVKIHGVVIGKMQVTGVTIDTMVRVELVFEANYTADMAEGPQGHYIEERWTLERALGVTSKPPQALYSFQCPSCGGPYERSDEGRCSRCAQQVEGGRFDWWLGGVRMLTQQSRPPALTGDVEEQGTNHPSVRDPDLEVRHTAFVAKDPSASTAALEQRVREIYAALNAAWTACDLRSIRPHVSDALHNYLSYWIDAYRAQGLRNVLKDMQLSRIEVVKLTRDRHFDAVTVRLWARGFDYTVTVDDGRRVSGNPDKPRAYSEYWTLIRGAGVRGAPRAPGVCPNCGAPLDRINMAGNCEACGTHLTRGEFDWVLSKIEQDESYSG